MAGNGGSSGRDVDAPTARWAVVAGASVTALALIWLIIDMLLAGYAGWGRGPNIGRGLIIFACYFLIAGGVALVALYGGFRMRRWNLGSWVAAGVIASLAVGFVSVRIIKPRDLEAGQVGRLGVTVSDAGDTVLVFAVCRGRIDHVRISGPYRGGPNEVLARYESNEPVRNDVVLDVTNPGAGWSATQAMGRDVLAREGLVIASAFGEKASLSTVSFSVDDLASLAPGAVLDGSGPYAQRRPLADFRAAACPDGS